MSYEAVIGLEVHVQLRTASKIFCRCPSRFAAEPNTLTCPVCLGYPGTLPVLNREAVQQALRLALALGATVHRRSAFARKSYFYPDLPKGYQITQYDRPLASGGELPLTEHDRSVPLVRLHLEEDAGKLLHGAPGEGSRVDFNRCGVPLAEVVTEPSLRTPAEAQDFLKSLRQLLLYTGTSDGNLEEGSLRCDANVSLRRPGEGLGTAAEVKNLNSFRFVARALEHEIARQGALLAEGARLVRETRRWDEAAGRTVAARSKEEAHDYRYFAEPDLPPLVVDGERVAALRAALPELPWETRARLAERYGLRAEDARVLASSPELAAYFEAAAAPLRDPSAAAHWTRTEVLRELKARRQTVAEAVAPGRLAAVLALVEDGRLSKSAGKRLLAELWERGAGEEVEDLAERLGLLQVRDRERLLGWVSRAIEENPRQAAEYRAGKEQLLEYFVGQVMRSSRGSAEPRRVRELLVQRLVMPS